MSTRQRRTKTTQPVRRVALKAVDYPLPIVQFLWPCLNARLILLDSFPRNWYKMNQTSRKFSLLADSPVNSNLARQENTEHALDLQAPREEAASRLVI